MRMFAQPKDGLDKRIIPISFDVINYHTSEILSIHISVNWGIFNMSYDW